MTLLGFCRVDVDHDHKSARPAFNLNLSSILFTSAAGGGKSSSGMENGLTEIVPSSDDITEWKLTLNDTGRSSFKVEPSNIVKTSEKIFVKYSGAKTDNNEYISAMIQGADDTVKYYGRVKKLSAGDESGEAEIDLSGITMESTDKLYVFNEQYNGDNKTDYASPLKEVSISAYANAYDVSTELENLTFEGTSYVLMNPSEDYTAKLKANSNYLLPENITVSVGTQTLTAGNGYTYNFSTGAVEIDKNAITGDIKIKAAARLTPEATPAAEINYGEETLTNLAAGNYTIQAGNESPENVSIDADGMLKIKEEWLGKTLFILKKGNGTTTADSAEQTLSIPGRLAKPMGLGAEKETVDGNDDGKITGTTTAMEYRLKAEQGQSEKEWESCGDGSTGNLAPETYEVRYKAVTTTGQEAFASAAVEITIGEGKPRNYSINVSAPGFTDVEYGYNRPEAQAVSISNAGNVPVTVTKAELTGTNSNAFELKRTDGTTGDITIAVNDKNETYTVQPKAGLSAGEYKASVQVTYQTDNGEAISTADVTFKVDKADSSVTITTGNMDRDYDGSRIIVPQYEVAGSKGAVTVTWYKNTGTGNAPVWTEIDTAPVDAGSYKVEIAVAADNNYNAVDTEKTFVIAKAGPTASDFTFTAPENTEYDGAEKTASVILKDGLIGLGAITVNYYDKDGKKLDSAPKEMGMYTVKIDVEEGDNYNAASEITDASWSFEIKEKQEASEPTTNPTDPSEPETSAGSSDTAGQSGMTNQGETSEAATGDDSSLLFAGILAIAAAAIATGAVITDRRKRQ